MLGLEEARDVVVLAAAAAAAAAPGAFVFVFVFVVVVGIVWRDEDFTMGCLLLIVFLLDPINDEDDFDVVGAVEDEDDPSDTVTVETWRTLLK